MHWVKKGLIYTPDSSNSWSLSHAQIPTPVQLNESTLRVFFATRNERGQTQTGFVDLDIEDPSIVKSISAEPVISMGSLGLHDDCGAMPFCVLSDSEGFKFYYTGWHVPTTVSYDLSIALAISNDLDCFDKYSLGPLISKNIYEPYWAAAPCVLKDNGLYRMWYISCYGWRKIDNRLEPVYEIKHAASTDGIHWDLNDKVSIAPKFIDEALGRPWVIRDGEVYKMWYSSRGSKDYRSKEGQHYSIGYAESPDGVSWERKDELAGITTSESGWDSEMIEYASIFVYKNRKYMFYNGNGFGKSGFGYAVCYD